MDASHFDRIVRSWAEAGSRRPVLGLLAGGVAALAGFAETSGKRKKKKKVTLCLNGQTITVPKKKKASYLSQGASAGKCPATCVPQCAGKTCVPDGCGGTCNNCPGNKTCQDGACACRPGEIECPADVCVPGNSVCCTDLDCAQFPGQRCLNGQCVIWQGVCTPSSDSCISRVSCSFTSNCACYQSMEGETRCGSLAPPELAPPCEVCESSTDCEARFPGIPGVFCVKKGDGQSCCPGACLRPCPTS